MTLISSSTWFKVTFHSLRTASFCGRIKNRRVISGIWKKVLLIPANHYLSPLLWTAQGKDCDRLSLGIKLAWLELKLLHGQTRRWLFLQGYRSRNGRRSTRIAGFRSGGLTLSRTRRHRLTWTSSTTWSVTLLGWQSHISLTLRFSFERLASSKESYATTARRMIWYMISSTFDTSYLSRSTSIVWLKVSSLCSQKRWCSLRQYIRSERSFEIRRSISTSPTPSSRRLSRTKVSARTGRREVKYLMKDCWYNMIGRPQTCGELAINQEDLE